MSSAKALTLSTSEASSSIQIETVKLNEAMNTAETDFKDGNDEILMKLKTDKASALEEINFAG